MTGVTNSSSGNNSCRQLSLGRWVPPTGTAPWDVLLESNGVTHQLVGLKPKPNHKQNLRLQVLPERRGNAVGASQPQRRLHLLRAHHLEDLLKASSSPWGSGRSVARAPPIRLENFMMDLGSPVVGLDVSPVCGSPAVGLDVSPVCGSPAVGLDVSPVCGSLAVGLDVSLDVSPVCGSPAVGLDVSPVCGSPAVGLDVSPVCGSPAVGLDVSPVCGSPAVGLDVNPVCGSPAVGLDVSPVCGSLTVGLDVSLVRGFLVVGLDMSCSLSLCPHHA
ncbi:hypothetical protein P7K49_027874 [Saguinus oedipus]|uniref:Uncharacterized protein n=1 Tax=Saguinus oedipus TaxID=9490 RepID=A0ABQ9UAQ9_SAGOE|nr:hypothetical protein P7K49_027874 [Saguinus oedipus]